jgi:putative transposase
LTFNAEKHHRRSMRLKGYDYSGAGGYFLTICSHDRDCIFGEVIKGQMYLNKIGRVVKEENRPRPRSIGSFVAGFKSSAAKRINKMLGTPRMPVWQRNFYEHIIRNEYDLNEIREYIVNNPLKWELNYDNSKNLKIEYRKNNCQTE